MKINGKEFEIKKITGYSNNIMRLTGNLKKLKDTSENVTMPDIKAPKYKITGYTENIEGSENTNPNANSFNLWETLRGKIEQIKPAIQQFKQSLDSVGTNSKELELVKYKISEIEEKLEKAKNGKIHLNTKEIIEAEALLERLNNKKEKMEKENSGKGFSTIFSSIGEIIPEMNKMSGITIKIKNQIKQWNSGIKGGLGQVLKYAGALFSLRSIYSILSSSAQAWLGSQNAQAKQLSANIDYMKYAMGSVFAPVIQYVTNLVYQLMKAIQSVVYAMSGVNIFAKATASSMNKTAGSASKASKSLSGVHNEINNVSSNSGSGTASPSMDLSNVDSEMSEMSQKLYNFFKPIVDSWNEYGKQVITAFKEAIGGVWQAISAMWKSTETLFTDGSIYSIIANILNSIGQIGNAWANAWNNDNNGTEIIQGIANMIDDITNAILNLVSSTGFQSFLEGIFSTFSGISQVMEPVVSGFINMSERISEIVLSGIGDILKLIGDTLQVIANNKIAVEVLKAIGEAIAVIVGVVILWNAVQLILNGLMGIFAILTSPITLIILAIVAAITAIILIIKNWGTISEWFQDLWVKITEKLQEVWNNIKTFFVNLWNSIISKIKAVWNGVKDFFSNIWNGIKTVAITIWEAIKGTISNVINGIKSTISNVLNGIKTIWNNIWNGLKTTVTNIFDKIWSTIKNVINSILGGIEGMANGIVNGVNTVIRALNKLKFDIPDWIPGLGGKTFGFNIGIIPQVSIPRLAKGNVAYDETLAIFGEYSGASNNPEITAPQSIMRETFEDVLSNYNGNNNDRPIYLTVNVGDKKLGQILLDDLRDKKRRTGKDIEALVGG